MLRSKLFLIILLTLTSSSLYAQLGELRGTVSSVEDTSGIAYAEVNLIQDSALVKQVFTSKEGYFMLLDIRPGTYVLQVYYMDYTTYSKDLVVRSGQSRHLEIALVPDGEVFDAIDIGGESIDVDEGIDIPIDGEEAKRSPYEGIGVLATDPTITSRGNGEFRFSDGRAEQTRVVQNGMIQIDGADRTTLNLGQVRAIKIGAPARYGDFAGGLVESTPLVYLDTISRTSAQISSNQFISPYGHNSLESFLYRPLWKRNGQAVVGLTHSFFVEHQADNNPYNVPLVSVDPNYLDELLEQPFGISSDGTSLPSYYFVEENNFNGLRKKPHADAFYISNQFNLQIAPMSGMVISIQPTYRFSRSRSYSFTNALFNAEHNPLNISHTGKINAQLRHSIKQLYNAKGQLMYDSTSGIGSMSYTINVDYQRLNRSTMDPIFQDNIFSYGHIGSFSSSGVPLYQYVEGQRLVEDQNGNMVNVSGYHELLGYQDTSLNFSVEENNYRSMFNAFLFEQGGIQNRDQLQQMQGLLNGQSIPNVYGIWFAPGTVISPYQKSDYQKATISASIDWSWHPSREVSKQHNFELGVLMEQSRRSYYSLNARGLWNLMPLLVNNQFVKLDTDNPILSYDENGIFMDTLNYNWVVDQRQQRTFDASLREVLTSENGYTQGNAHFIDVNSVDPTALSLAMFSANELWNNGNTYVNYSGYDHLGNLLRSNASQLDFFDKNKRSVPAFDPIYMAMWFQDKFVLKNINIRAGFRVERYDANQMVLRDKYSLYPTHTVSSVKEMPHLAASIPSNVSDDHVVYVDDMNSPNKITGYRHANKWFDANGNQISSAELIRTQSSNGVIQPFLVDPENQELNMASFKDYDPKWLFLPRVSLSFPINTKATFFAYYDAFAQRPNYAQSFAPMNNYEFIEQNTNAVLPNPELRPSQRTDYLLGFRQAIGTTSLLSISAGYAEIKDDINLVSVDQAYPISYLTYDNIDFATVKSFKAEFKTRKKKVGFRMSYMLQYADGTGSNANSAFALVQTNQPNLRSLYPLSYDIRHKLNTSVSIDLYELGDVLVNPWFENSSLNVFFNSQSGSPYTAFLNAIPEARNLGVPSRSQIKGNPFGSRLPWIQNLDMSYIKGFMIGGGMYELQVNALNVLNVRNVIGVYSFSGLPTDDGYLSSQEGQQNVAGQVDPETFTYLYNLKQMDPSHFGAPRRISLTLRAMF